MDAHNTLGVAPDATAEEVTRAYRQLARALHPDAHPRCSPEERAGYECSMALVNDAYRALASPSERRPHARIRRPRGGSEPGPNECSVCGHAPAEPLSFTYQVGLLFSRKRVSMPATLCRDCGRAVGRSHQDHTLRTGWWGPTLFVTNLGVVFRNARALRSAQRIEEPTRVSGVTGRLAVPMPPGNPVAFRAGFWVLPLLLAVVACIWLGARVGDSSPVPPGNSLAPGACIVGMNAVRAVPCTEPHDAQIVAEADQAAHCPAVTQAFLDAGRRVLCVRFVP